MMTTYLYSESLGGFLIKGLHADVPADAVEVDQELYELIQEGRRMGKPVAVQDGKLELQEIKRPTVTWEQIRTQRDGKLASCDWTQLADVKLSDDLLARWNKYRQKLRDITESFATPDKVVWPMAPNTGEEA